MLESLPCKQIENEKIGHHVHRCRGVAEFVDQLDNPVFRLHRQRDVDVINLAFARHLDQLVKTADTIHIVGRMLAVTRRQTVVEETDETHAKPGRVAYFLLNLHPHLGFAGNGQCPSIATRRTE